MFAVVVTALSGFEDVNGVHVKVRFGGASASASAAAASAAVVCVPWTGTAVTAPHPVPLGGDADAVATVDVVASPTGRVLASSRPVPEALLTGAGEGGVSVSVSGRGYGLGSVTVVVLKASPRHLLAPSVAAAGSPTDAPAACRDNVEPASAPASPRTSIRASNRRACAALSAGDVAAAERHLQAARSQLDAFVDLPPHTDRVALHALTLSNFGCLFMRQLRPGAAQVYLERAVQLEATLEEAHDVQSDRAAETLLNLAAAFSQAGLHADAKDTIAQAVERLHAQATDEVNRSSLATAYHNLGVELEFLGDARGATTALQSALDVAQVHLGASHGLTAHIQETLERAQAVAGRHAVHRPPRPASPDPLSMTAPLDRVRSPHAVRVRPNTAAPAAGAGARGARAKASGSVFSAAGGCSHLPALLSPPSSPVGCRPHTAADRLQRPDRRPPVLRSLLTPPSTTGGPPCAVRWRRSPRRWVVP